MQRPCRIAAYSEFAQFVSYIPRVGSTLPRRQTLTKKRSHRLRLPAGQSGGSILSNKNLFSKATLAYVKVT